MIILAIGDICGKAGLQYAARRIPTLRRDWDADLVIANGENAAVYGITPEQAETLLDAGADVITLGNHSFKRREIGPYMDESQRVLRPANFAGLLPGRGHGYFETPRGLVCVMNLIGRCDLPFGPDNPFTVGERIAREAASRTRFIVADFHAEATSEKCALAWHLDGRVSAIFGTHTHVQTADERIFPGGTGFITDLGMTGAARSVIGVRPEESVAYFLGDMQARFVSAQEEPMLCGAAFALDDSTGLCTAVERICVSD